jgi:hypothetical protein
MKVLILVLTSLLVSSCSLTRKRQSTSVCTRCCRYYYSKYIFGIHTVDDIQDTELSNWLSNYKNIENCDHSWLPLSCYSTSNNLAFDFVSPNECLYYIKGLSISCDPKVTKQRVDTYFSILDMENGEEKWNIMRSFKDSIEEAYISDN